MTAPTTATSTKKFAAIIAAFLMVFAMIPMGATSAHAVATYSVSGRVTFSNTATSGYLGNVTVQAYDTSGNTVGSSVLTTDDVTTRGAYTITGLSAGTYTLKFSKTGYVSQYLGTSATLAGATTFALAADVTGKDALLVQQGSVTGTITAAAATTTIWVHNADGKVVASTDVTHGATGTYTISNIDPGNYYLEFTSTQNITEWSGDAPSFLTAAAVAVTSGNPTTVSPTLVANTSGLASATLDAVPTISGTAAEGLTLTASATVPGGYSPNYQWLSGGTAIPGAIKSTYVVASDDAGRQITVSVFLSRIGYVNSAARVSAATDAATHAFVTAPVPTITGTATVGEVLTANTGTWSPTPDSFTYQWYYGGAIIPSATGSTYTVTSFVAGWPITVKVTALKAGYPNTDKTSVGTAAVGNYMTNTPTPTITGLPAVGKTLTAVPGTWTPATATFTYQWYRNSVAISGATASSYTMVAADYNTYISVAVTGSAATYTSVTKSSASLGPVAGKLTAPTPTITGKTTVGSTLTADPGTWETGVTLSYQWFRNSVAIAGATNTTYTLVQADDLTNITIKVTGAKSGYGDETVTSANFQVGKQFTLHPDPSISGNLWVGQSLRVNPGKWDTGTTFTYQWYRNGTPIASATNVTYKLVTADIGTKITVTATGSLSGYVPKTSTSTATAAILNGKPFTKSATPVITGSLKVGKTLGTNNGYWNPSPTKVTYQWLRNLLPITGATAKTYKLTAADKGTSIRVKITVTKTGYATTTKTSRPSSAVK